MHGLKRIGAALAVTASVAAVVPAAAGAAPRALPQLPGIGSNANICLQGVPDLGPFGPMGPYGPSGPYGANGPLHGQANPIGNAATCGGLLTYILRGGTLHSFVKASLTGVH
ncbi:MAG: hypothetical protein QOE86_866 [Solirubrobacteraceae bacterium]|nr:hypothetical protein [Solirubrobacteraceae bacterium]